MQGDTWPPLLRRLEDENGIPNLAGSVVTFRMEPAANTGITAPLIHTPAVVVDPSAVEGDEDYGKVMYTFADADTATPGVFRAQFVVTWSGAIESFPSDGYIDVIIRKRVAP
jgi:hypothetical protein